VVREAEQLAADGVRDRRDSGAAEPGTRAGDSDRPPPSPLGTVGAVCCDAHGHLAAATSTGGAPNTLPGRVGDSPVLGAEPAVRNEPANLPLAVKAIAGIKGIPEQQVVEAVAANTVRLYGPLVR